MSDKYKLDGHTPVLCEDLMEWARWFEKADRKVARTELSDVSVSTVFLSLNHSYEPGGQPILFETMIFGGEHDGYCERYATWDEAIKGHEFAVAMILTAQ